MKDSLEQPSSVELTDYRLTLDQIRSTAEVVYESMLPTPQYRWPLLSERLGASVLAKHENYTPLGAFKVRGGLAYFDHVSRHGDRPDGVVSATRGNHGQSVAFGASRAGIPSTIVVPHGNSIEKNQAMVSLGATLIEHGDDFQAAREYAKEIAETRSLEFVPSFHPILICGVASYCLEFLGAANDLDVVYVPIGLGSGICAMIATRDALGLKTKIVGVVSAHARAYLESIDRGVLTESPSSTKLADGMACRTPEADALNIIERGAERIVEVTDDEIAGAMRMIFETTHSCCEGAGAASVAAANQERAAIAGQRVGVVFTGGNVDRDMFAAVLSE